MTRTFKTIAALVLICVSAPAFAHGGGHGGNAPSAIAPGGNGGDGQTGHVTNSMTWNKVNNTVTQSGDHRSLDRHHDHPGKINTVARLEQIKRLEAEFRRLTQLLTLTKNPRQLAHVEREIRRVVLALKNDGALVD